ncbi:MAG: Do family serine endopeptidase [Deltaproteobacteria bacterium]|nr:Do family serine endopeptidase [Deltaproteobacteria bacterium]
MDFRSAGLLDSVFEPPVARPAWARTMLPATVMARFVASVVAAVALGVLGCRERFADLRPEPPAEASPPAVQPEQAARPPWARGDAPEIADIVSRVRGSVVNISAEKLVEVPRSPLYADPLYRYFFGEPPARRRKSLGSGVVASADGFILTNAHVIEGADEIQVQVERQGRVRQRFEARVVGADRPSDLALLRIDAQGLGPLELADSSLAREGDLVLALGNPFGVGQTVTMGIISAKGRADIGIAEYEDFIQTDAAINPGNSGGALVDMRGRLVGINTAILSRTGGSLGIGFAIPSNMVRDIMRELRERGHVSRGWLGIEIQELTPELVARLGVAPDTEGVVVAAVRSGGPAAAAGIVTGDVIVALDGRPIESAGHLRNAIAALGAGRRARLEVRRGGRTRTARVVLGQLPSSEEAVGIGGESLLRGVSVGPVDDEVRRRLRLRGHVEGVVVTGVLAGSPAWEVGLREGDLVISVNGRRVRSPAEFEDQARVAADRAVVLVMRRGRQFYLSWSGP